MFAAVLILAAASPAEPIPATLATIEPFARTLDGHAEFMSKQSNIRIVAKGAGPEKFILDREPPQAFWSALEKVAASTNSRIEISDQGRVVNLVAGRSKQASSIAGPFRITVREIISRIDPATGVSSYDATLLVHWEPRIPVFRIDSQPTIAHANDDRGTVLAANVSKAKSAIGDAAIYTATVRLNGLTRASKSIAKLTGEFVVTASPKMIVANFDDLSAKLPLTKEIDGVRITLAKFNLGKPRVDVDVRLEYPDSHPQFESFESWADRNTATLIAPDRTKIYLPDNFSTNGNGRKVTGEYRFFAIATTPVLSDRSGWILSYSTPAPMIEFAVQFTLTDIPLP
jgi:hypothetical protein